MNHMMIEIMDRLYNLIDLISLRIASGGYVFQHKEIRRLHFHISDIFCVFHIAHEGSIP